MNNPFLYPKNKVTIIYNINRTGINSILHVSLPFFIIFEISVEIFINFAFVFVKGFYTTLKIIVIVVFLSTKNLSKKFKLEL